jgi:hypothetical protein
MLLTQQANRRVRLQDDPTPAPGAGATEPDEVLIDALRGFALPTTSLSAHPAAASGQGLRNKMSQGFLNDGGILNPHRGGGRDSKPALFLARDVVDNQVLDARIAQSQHILGPGARSEAWNPRAGIYALNSGISLLDPEVSGNQTGGATVGNTAPQELVGNRDVIKSTPIVRLDNFRQPFNSIMSRAPMQAPNPYQSAAFQEYVTSAQATAAGANARRLRAQARRAD